MSDLEITIEQDGPRYRWVLRMVGKDIPAERRLAKGTRWWDSESAAQCDADEFLDALPNARIARDLGGPKEAP